MLIFPTLLCAVMIVAAIVVPTVVYGLQIRGLRRQLVCQAELTSAFRAEADAHAFNATKQAELVAALQSQIDATERLAAARKDSVAAALP